MRQSETNKMKGFLLLTPIFLCGFAIGDESDQYSTPIDITTQIGEELIISAEGVFSWTYCTWDFKERSCSRTIESAPKICNISQEQPLFWFGQPNEDKKCSLFIKSVDFFHEGTWTCKLRDQTDVHESQQVQVNVRVQSQAQVKFASRPFQTMFAGKEYKIDCSSWNGSPLPSLSAFVGPTQDISDTDVPLTPLPVKHENGMEVSQLFNYIPTTDYTNLYLKCMAHQKDDNDLDVFPPTSVFHPFQVVFPPLAHSSKDLTFFFEEGENVEVSITIKANPVPKRDQVCWVFLGSDNFELQPGDTKNQFEALMIESDSSSITATLRIYGVTQESDKQYFHYLKVENEHGEKEYPFLLLKNPEPDPDAEVTETDINDSDGFPVWAIVVIVVGVIFFISALTILLMFLRHKNACCWSQGKIKKTYFSVEQQDNDTSYQRPVSTHSTNFLDMPDGSFKHAISSQTQDNETSNPPVPPKPVLLTSKLCLESSL